MQFSTIVILVACVIITVYASFYIILTLQKSYNTLHEKQLWSIKTLKSQLTRYQNQKNKINIPIPMYYINLDRSPERKKFMENQMKNINGTLTRVAAFDGKNRDGEYIDGVKFHSHFTNYSADAEIAVTMSHLKAIHLASKSNSNFALILEDDASFELFHLLPRNIVNDLLRNIPTDAGIIQLSWFEDSSCCSYKEQISFSRVDSDTQCWGAVAYIVTRKGMNDILSVSTVTPKYINILKYYPHQVFGVSDAYIYNLTDTYHTGIPIVMPDNSKHEMLTTTFGRGGGNHDEMHLKNYRHVLHIYLTHLKKFGQIPVDFTQKVKKSPHRVTITKRDPIITPPHKFKIPLKIYQTHEHRRVSLNMATAIQSIKKHAEDCSYEFFDSIKRRRFIQEYYPSALDAYDVLIPGAYKSDLFRAIILYVQGGIYIDSAFNVPDGINLTQDVLTHNDTFVTALDEPCHNGVLNGFIASVPHHPLLKAVIDMILDNIKNKRYFTHYGKTCGPLAITGPLVYKHAATKLGYPDFVLGKNEKGMRFLKFDTSNPVRLREGKKTLYYVRYHQYDKDRSFHSNNQSHYRVLWRKKKIYK